MNEVTKKRGRPPVVKSAELTHKEKVLRAKKRAQDSVLDNSKALSLYIPEGKKDPNYRYYWALDHGNQIEILKEDDWEVVDNNTLQVTTSSIGSTVERIGDKEKGKNHVLMRRHKDFCEIAFDRDQKKADKKVEPIFEKNITDSVPNERGIYKDHFKMENEHSREMLLPRKENIESN